LTRDEEAAIINRVLAGETNAFEALVLEHQSRVYHLTLKMTGNEEDAYDLSQEAFLKAYRTLSSFRGEAGFGSWVYRIAANLSVDFLRRQKRRGASKVISLDEPDENGRPVEIPDLAAEPQTELERKETRKAIRAGLDALPEEQKLILILRDVQDLSYQQISEALELEPGTVKSRISRARAHLARLLTESGNFSRKTSSKGKERG